MITSEIKDATKVSVNELLSGSIKCPLQHAQIDPDCKGIEPLDNMVKIYGLNVIKHNILNE